MKKLIAISVMIALIAGAAFAETAVSGGMEARWVLYNAEFGDHSSNGGIFAEGEYPKPTANGAFGAAHIQLSGASDDGSLSGLFRLRNVDIVRSEPWFHRVFVNWKPVDQINFFLGIDQDGKFATDALEGWAFHQGADDYIHFQWWDFWRAVYPGNWDGYGAAFSFFLVPGLDLNLVLPLGQTNWPQATSGGVGKETSVGDLYTAGWRLQAGYAIQDVGKIMFSYKGPLNQHLSEKRNLTFEDGYFGSIGVSVLIDKIVDGLSAHVGFATDNLTNDPDDEGLKTPMYFGASAHYQAGDLGVKFRLGAALNYSYEEGHFFLTANIMPWYNLGALAAHLDAGVSFNKDDADADMDMGFWVNPYIKVPISGGAFRVGLSVRKHINGHGNVMVVTGDDYIRVDVPMLLGFNF